jgi:hypothetical protein
MSLIQQQNCSSSSSSSGSSSCGCAGRPHRINIIVCRYEITYDQQGPYPRALNDDHMAKGGQSNNVRRTMRIAHQRNDSNRRRDIREIPQEKGGKQCPTTCPATIRHQHCHAATLQGAYSVHCETMAPSASAIATVRATWVLLCTSCSWCEQVDDRCNREPIA